MVGDPPHLPFNQEALLNSSSSDEDDGGVDEDEDEEQDDEEKNKSEDDAEEGEEGEQLAAEGGALSFRLWFQDDRNIQPKQKIPYIFLVMTTLDESFDLEAGPFAQLKKKQRLFKPTLILYKKELRCCDPKAPISNKKLDSILPLLRGKLRIDDPEDIAFVKKRWRNKRWFCSLPSPRRCRRPPTSAARASNIRKFDRMRFVECMALDTVKPLYLKVNEVMTRYELDGRNS